jgi:GINS complex subunit 4
MATEESASVMDDYETLISTTDVELLKRAWRNEKAAPEILQFESSLVQRIKEQIELAVIFLFEIGNPNFLVVS